ncbi:MAG: trigger factor [Pseudomonadales bacterium]|nr:trigger factor [Pseudomonadales bacterium]
MNVSIETTSGLERRLTIALPSEDFETQITQKLEEAKGQVRIPGFRPGKVPLKEVRRRYGRAVRAEVAGEMMQESFISAVTQESLNPAGQPNLEVVKMDPGIDFEFTATFEVFPSIEATDFAKAAVKQPKTEITTTDVDQMVERLREQRAEHVDVDRAAIEGDKVKVDFQGTLDGEVFEGGSGEDMEFVLGQGQMIADFDQAVIGMKSGDEKSFEATFPDDYHSEEMKSKTVTFEVTVKGVQESKVPELDETLFKEFGVEEGGEEAFREEVQSNMQRELDAAVKNQVKQQVMDEIEKLHDFPLPSAVVGREIDVLKQQMLGQFQMPAGAQAPDLPNDLFLDQAEKRVKVGLVVNQIITDEALIADEDKVNERLAEIATQYGEAEQVISWYRSQPEQMQNIEMGVLEDQVVDLILEQASIEVVESSYDDVISGRAVAPEPEPELEAESGDSSAEESEDSDDTLADKA